MAQKKKAELTHIQKTAAVARDKFAKAQEAVAKNKTAATEAAVASAKTEMEAANKAENRERFTRVGGARVGKVISSIENVGKLAKPRAYEFSEADIAKIETAATSALTTALTALRNAHKPKGAAAVSAFQF